MKKFALGSLVVAFTLLTACASNDSDDSEVKITPIINNPNPNAKITGEILVDDDYVIGTGSNDINQLNVGGRTFNINPTGIISGDFTNINNRLVISGTHLTHAKYGILNDWQDDNDYVFYQGKKTPVANIPTTGTANYTGKSLYTCDNCYDQVLQGTSQFTADFGKKTLTGSISNSHASNVALNAIISGNSFNGTSSLGTQTRGAFFGDNAQEISGIYWNDRADFEGAFGATQK